MNFKSKMLFLGLFLIAIVATVSTQAAQIHSASHYHPNAKHLKAFGLPDNVAELRSAKRARAAKGTRSSTNGVKDANRLIGKLSQESHIEKYLAQHLSSVSGTVSPSSDGSSVQVDAAASNTDGWFLYTVGAGCNSENPLMFNTYLMSNCVQSDDDDTSFQFSNCVPDTKITKIEYSDPNCQVLYRTTEVPFPNICEYDYTMLGYAFITCVPMQSGNDVPSVISGEYFTER